MEDKDIRRTFETQQLESEKNGNRVKLLQVTGGVNTDM